MLKIATCKCSMAKEKIRKAKTKNLNDIKSFSLCSNNFNSFSCAHSN